MIMLKRWAATGLMMLCLPAACSKDDSAKGGSGGTGATAGSGAGDGGDGGASTGGGASGSTSGPAISSAPPAWERPADCGGIGNLCPNLSGCEERSTCQLEGNVCIPALVPGNSSLPSKSAERPYCAAYTCMTFEEASCFCTGAAGETVSGCASPSELAGLCVGKGRSCATTACCDGYSCVDNGSGGKTCEIACTTGSECETGCCTDLRDNGFMICAKLEACENPCKKRGEACQPGSSTMANDCCRGACVQSDNPDFAGCRPRCTTNADCPDTGCCQLFADSSSGFCADAVYCSCAGVGQPCGMGPPSCCEGSVCAGFSAETLSCFQLCSDNSECATGCCSALAMSDQKICSEPSYCQ